jgi:hypothetical protein
MKHQLGVGWEAQVGERRRHRRFLQVAREMHFERYVRGLGDGPQRSRQFAVRTLFVGRLNALDGGPELIRLGFLQRLGQEMHAGADGQHLSSLALIQVRQCAQGSLLGSGEMVFIAHAERIIHRDDEHLSTTGGAARAADKRIGEGQRDEQQQGDAQGKQQQVAQTAMLDGALRSLLEEHQRAEGMRRAAVLAEKMDPKRQANGYRAGQEPGGEKSHATASP